MPKPNEKNPVCESCGLPDRPLVKERCARCWMLYGPPPEKPRNGKVQRSCGLLDRAAYRERLHFVASGGRVH